VGEPDLIETYLQELNRCLGRRGDAADDVAEAADHLREATERLELAGMDPVDAQRRALERFGDPVIVARALSMSSTGGIAMPTDFTRTAGTAAVIAAVGWLASIATAMILDTYEWQEQAYLLFAVVVGVTGVSTVLALSGLNARAGGRRDAWTVIALVLAIVAALMLLVVAWAWIVWVQLLAASALVIVIRSRSAHVRSSASDWLLVGAWPMGLLGFIVADRMRLGDVDTYGDYPAAATAGLAIGAVLFAAGLLPLGRWLRSEPVAQVAQPLPAG
jgi:hypothetical protein